MVGNTIALAPVDLNASAKRACRSGRVTESSERYSASVGTMLFVAEMVPRITETMESVWALEVPLTVEVGQGHTWAEAH